MRYSPLGRAAAAASMLVLASAGVAAAAPAPTASVPASAPAAAPAFAKSCAAPAQAGYAACFAVRRTDLPARSGVSPQVAPAGFGPADLRAAYQLPASGGAGRTVAIVDAYDAPHAESDLATYRAQYGLGTCTTANGCFRKVNQAGNASPLPAANAGWAEEIALDLDMVSAVCPDCKILLVEANTPSIANLGKSVNTAVTLGAKYVSNSYGGSESAQDPTYDTQYYRHDGVAVTASSGDSGYGTSYPAASRFVTAVGGTHLVRSGSSWTETVWNGAGSGCSKYDAKPSWQADAGCAKRTIADVSAVADPNTGVAVYSTEAGGWAVFGGTSVSSPVIAAVYALAGTPAAGSTPASYPYAHPGALRDVTSGKNGTCTKRPYLCTAQTGYDGPTGLGTPQGLAAFQP